MTRAAFIGHVVRVVFVSFRIHGPLLSEHCKQSNYTEVCEKEILMTILRKLIDLKNAVGPLYGVNGEI